jgi:hypothetical protein
MILVASQYPRVVCLLAVGWYIGRSLILLLFGRLRCNKSVPGLAIIYAAISVSIIYLGIGVCSRLGIGFGQILSLYPWHEPSAWLAATVRFLAYVTGISVGLAFLWNCSRAFFHLTELDEGCFAGEDQFLDKITSPNKHFEWVIRVFAAYSFLFLEQTLDRHGSLDGVSHYAAHIATIFRSADNLLQRLPFRPVVDSSAAEAIRQVEANAQALFDVGCVAFVLYCLLFLWSFTVWKKMPHKLNFLILFGCGGLNAVSLVTAGLISSDPDLALALSFFFCLIFLCSAVMIFCIVQGEYAFCASLRAKNNNGQMGAIT